MRTEDKVCSFEQAQKLVELGLNLKTYFGWFIDPSDVRDGTIIPMKEKNETYEWNWDFAFPAYDVAELGILLPQSISVWFEDPVWLWVCEISSIAVGCSDSEFKTEAQARTDALIWSIENKQVDIERLSL